LGECFIVSSSFEDHYFLILGATGSVGQALARNLHAQGSKLVLIARDEVKLGELGAELGAQTATISELNPAKVRDVVVTACKGLPITGIAHCIGSLLLKPAKRTSDQEWHDIIETNLSSAFGVTMAAGDLIKNGGSVVFCSSVAATLGLANHEAIAAAKAGLIGLARAAAASHVRRGIRFHCVAPALVESQMTAGLLQREGMREAAAKQNPSGRLGTPQDVARAIQFFLDPENSWIDAQVLGVDGGFGVIRGLS
jgi:3-oxoacyl-[acyl-carrier protein] reductase